MVAARVFLIVSFAVLGLLMGVAMPLIPRLLDFDVWLYRRWGLDRLAAAWERRRARWILSMRILAGVGAAVSLISILVLV